MAATAAALALLGGCSGPSLEVLERHPNPFLARQGTDLRLQGQRYRFVGLNAFTLTGCGFADQLLDDAQLDVFFASLRPHSLVRTFAYASMALPAIDRVVAAARAHGHMLILSLAGHDAGCQEPAKDQAFYQTGFRDTYLPWVQQIVARFKDDPAVGMWEPISAPVNIDKLTLRTFFDVVGGEIHRIDSNHLVESGTHGPWAYDADGGYAFIHESAGIDVASFRDYDTTHPEPPNLAPSLSALATVGKPLILVEAGMFASIPGDPTKLDSSMMPCISWPQRRDRFAAWLGVAFSTDLAGVGVWNWTPDEKSSQTPCQYDTAPSDPLVQLVHDYPVP